MPEHRASSGGVRSLRAMFEQSEDASPPEARGRSPVPSVSKAHADSTVSPRPVSKVRTSFVGVEFTEQLGRVLSRGDSAHRAGSRAVSEYSEATGEQSLSRSPAAIRRPIMEDDEGEVPPIETVISKVKSLSRDQDRSIPHPDKPTSAAEDKGAQLKPADPKDENAVSGGAALQPPAEPMTPLAKKAGNSSAKERSTPNRSIALAAKMSTPQNSTHSPSEARRKPQVPPADADTINASESSTPATKAPTASKSSAAKPLTPFSRDSSGPALHHPASGRTQRANARTSMASVSSMTSTATNGTRTPGGFVKPKPRSPTRPVKLPAHLTAQTASSAAKHQPEAPPQQKTISKKTSTRSLASSVGPGGAVPRYMQDTRKRAQPDKEEKGRGSRQGRTAHTAPPDEGFLARMMRPTASSASKVHAKEEPAPKPKATSRRTSGKHVPHATAISRPDHVGEAPEPIDETEYEHIEAEQEEAPNGEPVAPPPPVDLEEANVGEAREELLDATTAGAAQDDGEAEAEAEETVPAADVTEAPASVEQEVVVPIIAEEPPVTEDTVEITAVQDGN